MVYCSFLELARDFVAANETKLSKARVLRAYLVLAINTSGILGRA
jgi:hypothetical protein